MMIYGTGAALFDALEEYPDLRDAIDRVFSQDETLVGVHSESLGKTIEGVGEIHFLPAGSVVAIANAGDVQAMQTVRRLNPHVQCLSLQEAYGAEAGKQKGSLTAMEKEVRTTASLRASDKVYLGLYDLTQANLRRCGLGLVVGRSSYLAEIQAQVAGNAQAMTQEEIGALSDTDFVEVVYQRILRRMPEAGELQRDVSVIQRLGGRKKLLQRLVEMRERQ